jgi:hypothetical protein
MKEKKQRIYILLTIGFTIFFTITTILLTSFFNSKAEESYDLKQIEITNVTTQNAEIFWKGFSSTDGFKVLFKEEKSTGAYNEVIPTNVYPDYSYTKGYLYKVDLNDLSPSKSYIVEIWNDDLMLANKSFTTKSIKEELEVPEPISGDTSFFDWVKISNQTETYIVYTDSNRSWTLDKNLVGDDYNVEVYATGMNRTNPSLKSLLSKSVYAAEKANCDEITYSGVPSKIKSKAATFENLLKQNGGPGGNPQYVRCYQDAYCEAEKYGVNGQWTLANWAHESNASDYEYPGNSLYEDFGVHCCGVPTKNFQAQLGFFLSLSHDPCNLGSGGTKEEYYCCWADNYLNGNKRKECTDQTRAYLNGLMAYYYWTSTSADPGSFEGRLSGLPTRIKGSSKNVSCGPTDSVEVYENGGEIPDDPEDPVEEGGICCGLKVTGNDQFRGDWEDIDNKSCEQIWQPGRSIYGGTLEYSEQISVDSRASCERWWDGVCCDVNGETEWLPERNCSKKISEYPDYQSCKNGVTPDEEVCCKDGPLYEWKFKRQCTNVKDEYNTEYKCERANGTEVTLNLELKEGYNFVGWNASDPLDPMPASTLFDNPQVLLVASFKDGVWNKIMYKQGSDIKGPDFNLLRGNAYLITTTEDLNFAYSGRTFTEFQWGNKKGWQFVPSEALEPYSTTKSIVLNFDDTDISQVGLWDKEVGKFNYYVYDTLGNEYGESVRLDEEDGVFVKID